MAVVQDVGNDYGNEGSENDAGVSKSQILWTELER